MSPLNIRSFSLIFQAEETSGSQRFEIAKLTITVETTNLYAPVLTSSLESFDVELFVAENSQKSTLVTDEDGEALQILASDQDQVRWTRCQGGGHITLNNELILNCSLYVLFRRICHNLMKLRDDTV